MKRADVVIVGGGAAGLATAFALNGSGLDCVLLEARDRLGGRILTERDPAFPAPVELGAEFVHGRPEATWRLLRAAGLLAYDVASQRHGRKDGALRLDEGFERRVESVMRLLPRRGRDMSFADFLREHAAGERCAEAREDALDFVQGFDAADPERVSARWLAEEQQGLANFEASPQFRLVDGYGALVERMRRALDRNVRVVENAVVDEIRWKPGEAEVRCGGGGKVRGAWRASAVVVTLPVGVLQRRPGERGAVRFSPPPCDHLEAAERLVDGPIVKVAVAFREPLWERPDVQAAAGAGADLADAVFLHDRGAPFPTWWTLRPLRAPMLVGWAGGPRTEGLVGRDSAEIADAAIRSLASLFGLTAARVRDAIVGVRACDWTSDPYARGAYSYVSVGALKARAALARPLAETLFFAGEATDDAGQAGTVAGALASGRRAAEEVRAASAGRGAGGDAARRRPSSSTSVEREAAAR